MDKQLRRWFFELLDLILAQYEVCIRLGREKPYFAPCEYIHYVHLDYSLCFEYENLKWIKLAWSVERS